MFFVANLQDMNSSYAWNIGYIENTSMAQLFVCIEGPVKSEQLINRGRQKNSRNVYDDEDDDVVDV